MITLLLIIGSLTVIGTLLVMYVDAKQAHISEKKSSAVLERELSELKKTSKYLSSRTEKLNDELTTIYKTWNIKKSEVRRLLHR